MKFNATSGGNAHPNQIKLKAGQSVSGILRGEVHEYEQAFKPGDKAKFRFRLNLVTKVDGAMKAMVLEGGWQLYQGLKQLSEAGWDLEKTYIKVSREGSTQNDTKYFAAVLPTPPTADVISAVEKIQLNDLKGPSAQPQPEQHHDQSNNSAGSFTSDLPF